MTFALSSLFRTLRTKVATPDLAADVTTTSILTAGGWTSSRIDTAGDVDWHAMNLQGGVTYTLRMNGYSSSTLFDSVILGVYANAGSTGPSLLAGTYNDDFGNSLFSRITFTVPTSGTYYVATGGFNQSTGGYSLGLSGVISTDVPGNITSTVGLTLGAPKHGKIDTAGDVDFYKVALTVGSYVIDLQSSNGHDALSDPFIPGVYRADGTLIPNTTNDDFGTGYNSRVNLTVTEAGTYFVAAGAYDTKVGDYVLSMRKIQTVTDAIGATAGSAAALSLGAPYTSAIDSARDVDWFNVNLTQGTRYRFDMRGADGGGGTLADPRLLGLRGPNGSVIAGTGNDNANGTRDASFEFTANATGRYTLMAGASGDFYGTYTVNVSPIASNPDIANTATTTAGVSLTQPYLGVLETVGDIDWVRLSVTEGRTYNVRVAGYQVGSVDAVADPDLAGIYNSAGTALTTRPLTVSGTADGATFTATQTGSVFVAIGADGAYTGGYRVTVGQVTDTVKPILVGTTPADNSTGVAVGSDITLMFSEGVQAGSGNIVLTPTNGGNAITIATSDAAQVTFSGRTVTLNPTADLDAGTQYQISLTAGAVRDAAGNTNLAVSGSASPDFTTAGATTPGTAGKDAWTIMIYLDGDNDLESFSIADFNEMEAVNLPSNVNLTVLYDRMPGYDSSNGNWTNTRYGNVSYDTNRSTISSNLTLFDTANPEQNLGDPATLTRFINKAMLDNPADHYGLVIWDHGGGLAGVAWDESNNGDNLSLRELRQAIDASNVDKFDFIGFDACLMGMVEQAFDLRSLADVMIASQELEPGDGWAYDRWLAPLAANPNMNAAEISRSIVSSYGSFYGAQPDITLASINLATMNQLETALDTFVATAKVSSTADRAAMAAAMADSPPFPSDGSMSLRDLGTWMRELATDVSNTNLKAQAAAVAAAVDASVIAITGTVSGATGLSVNLPANGDYSSYYTENQFSYLSAVDWRGLLDLF